MRRGTLAVLATATAAAWALSGCTDDAEPKPLPSLSGVASASPVPSASSSNDVTESPSPTTAAPSSNASEPEPSEGLQELSKPTLPKDLSDEGKDGAIAAAEYFLSLYPYALSSTSKSEFASMSDPSCEFCSSVIADVEARKKAKTHEIGGSMTFRNSTVAASSEGSYLVLLTARQQPSQTVTASGAVVKDFPRTTDNDATIVVHRARNRWFVREVSVDNIRDA
ncbi:hypothetical protein IC607_01650 [Cellulomonas sp. JH27-2]|uniref:DUF6318 family protein n=1 Tax=Cellulomonas sp. JH27-2 TaxID=2774139 RepID=UPI00178029F5|nr:DUF6318 family protein [Cellulomonas sp. JH27-2]MBD8057672.1 hypothetical protein [Cellulomonas sp. JH27-2]